MALINEIKAPISKGWIVARDSIFYAFVILGILFCFIPLVLIWINDKLDPTSDQEK